MKEQHSTLKTCFVFVTLLAGLLAPAARAATLSVTPAAVSNNYTGVITLNIGGLTNNETVVVSKYLDANGNGVLESFEPLVDSFRITDGGASVIGGVTNLNVAYDGNAATGAISATLNQATPLALQNLVGAYIYRVVSPGNNFSPTNATFVITNAAYAQTVSGTIYSNGVGPLAGAVVVVLESSVGGDGGGRYVAGVVADATGHYQLALSPGNYVLMPTMPGYFTDQSLAVMVALTSGMSATNDLVLSNYTATISGDVHNSGNGQPIGGVLMTFEGSNNLFGVAFTDTNGNYTAGVSPGFWKVKVESDQLASRAFLVPQQNLQADTTTGSVVNAGIGLSKANALIYGTFTNVNGAPMANLRLSANDDANQFDASGFSDANGNYCVAVLGGSNVWNCSPDNKALAAAGVIVSTVPGTNVPSNTAQLRNFIAAPATNHITGFVKNSSNQPMANVNVNANANINGIEFGANSQTDTNGAYSLLVAHGNWNLNLDCNYVQSLGYNCPGAVQTNIVNADAVVNFIVSTLAVTTTTLPDATNGVYYSYTLTASGGQPPYVWSLSPGSAPLPDGMTLDTNGVLSGTPTFTGGPSFTVRVTDSLSSTADQFVTLFIQPGALQITTTSLPGGMSGQFYFQQLFVTGGTPPYTWYLPGGSAALPPGLSFNTNGVLSGNPTTNGFFNFDVAVYVNNPYQVATQSLSLTITPAPLQVTTGSPLPVGTQGASYSCPLSAMGGVPPYKWTLAPYSASLPAGLALTTNGVLQGIPSVFGTFYFSARVTDTAAGTNDAPFQLTINSSGVGPAPVVLHGVGRPGPGQFRFSFDTQAGTNYTIQYTATLVGPWTSVLTFTSPGGTMTVIDPNATGPRQFYRVRIGP